MTTRAWESIRDDLLDGKRLDGDSALYLMERAPLLPLLALADTINQRVNGPTVTYNINIHVNPTNICEIGCRFCAFSRRPGAQGGYALTHEQIQSKISSAVECGATEAHLTGGCNPEWDFDHYRSIVASIRRAAPDLHIKAFTAVEIDWFAARAGISVTETLRLLRSDGLSSMPGGGAEIFAPETRRRVCADKISGNRWLEIHQTAHGLGIATNATMLYGHVESAADRIDHLLRLRALQDTTRGFTAFVPLPFLARNNELADRGFTSAETDLRVMAIARLTLDNIRHIKAYWVMLGIPTATLALHAGANDLDGTVTEEDISQASGSTAGQCLAVQSIRGLIQRAGRLPIERDSLHRARTAVPSSSGAPVPCVFAARDPILAIESALGEERDAKSTTFLRQISVS